MPSFHACRMPLRRNTWLKSRPIAQFHRRQSYCRRLACHHWSYRYSLYQAHLANKIFTSVKPGSIAHYEKSRARGIVIIGRRRNDSSRQAASFHIWRRAITGVTFIIFAAIFRISNDETIYWAEISPCLLAACWAFHARRDAYYAYRRRRDGICMLLILGKLGAKYYILLF